MNDEPTPRTRRAAEITAVALTAAAGVLWVTAMFVPWAGAGVLARLSPADAAGLVRGGFAGVPTVAALAVLVLPLLAALLLALAPLRGVGVLVLRVLVWLIAALAGSAGVVAHLRFSGADLGTGSLLAIVAILVGGVALTLSTVHRGSAGGTERG